ncbi:xylose isomerase-like protein [Mariannaea sp. PMI_226]|nr:xylose isomerase-like protein [Mariannaea sp. PMI_226]
MSSSPICEQFRDCPCCRIEEASLSSCTGAQRSSNSTRKYLPAIATMSLGNTIHHHLETKLEAASKVGFQGIELFWDDLMSYTERSSHQIAPFSYTQNCHEKIVSAASDVRQLCDRLNLKLSVAQELGADTIGVPSAIGNIGSADYGLTGDSTTLAKDLVELAVLAIPYGIRIAYENLCFAAHIQDWSQAWGVICQTGKPGNIVFLPDTFNICGALFADPSARSGIARGGEELLGCSLQKLTSLVPMNNMPLLQGADAAFMHEPLVAGHPWLSTGMSSKMAWSRNARLFPFEYGGYLPITAVVKTLVAAGWCGWVSMEVFSRSLGTEGEEAIWKNASRAGMDGRSLKRP